MQKGFVSAGIALVIIFLLLVAGILIYKYSGFLNSNDSSISLNPDSSKPSLESELPVADKVEAKGKVAFVLDNEIWVIDSDGKNKAQITDDEFNKFDLAISPDGLRVAYAFYPDDEGKRTNGDGIYVGLNTGVGVVSVEDKKSATLVPYGSIQNYDPIWSPDGKYLSVWVGTGKESKLIDVVSGKTVFSVKDLGDQENDKVSPIVFKPGSNKINYVQNGKVIVSDIDGGNKELLASGADSYKWVHEAPPVADAPDWSPSGKYVYFYKNGGDLYLVDSLTKKEVLVDKGVPDFFTNNGPHLFVLGFSKDESKLLLGNTEVDEERNPTGKREVLGYVIQKGSFEKIADFSPTSLSPNKQVVYGDLFNPYRAAFLNLDNLGVKECPGYFDLFAGWSPDLKGILGYDDHKGEFGSDLTNVQILNIESCTVFPLMEGAIKPNEIYWFP